VLQRNFHALIVIDALDGLFEIELVQWKKAPLLASVETYMCVRLFSRIQLT